MSATAVDEMVPISISTLVSSVDLQIDLYLQDEAGQIKLYRGAQYPLKEDDLRRLRSRGVKKLLIKSDQRDRYQSYLRSIAWPMVDGPSVEFRAQIAAVNEVVRDVLAEDFQRNDTASLVDTASQLSSLTADLITHDRFAAADLIRVLHHDYATFTHSANVSFYAAMLAAELGLPLNDIQRIAAGGLLHDLGKLDIDPRILAKPQPLTSDELRAIRDHPTIGFRRLARRDDLSAGQLMMVYQHHERLDGSGYPTGCKGDEIHLWGKICTVVDVFEALTSHRPYRAPMVRTRAMELLQRDSGTAFEPEILACWGSIIQRTCKT